MTGWVIIILIVAALVHGWLTMSHDWKQDTTMTEPEPESEKPESKAYEIVFMNPDGSLIGESSTSNLPRHIFLFPRTGKAWGSDNWEPPETFDDHYVAFDRIGSSVHVDDERNALFVRRV